MVKASMIKDMISWRDQGAQNQIKNCHKLSNNICSLFTKQNGQNYKCY